MQLGIEIVSLQMEVRNTKHDKWIHASIKTMQCIDDKSNDKLNAAHYISSSFCRVCSLVPNAIHQNGYRVLQNQRIIKPIPFLPTVTQKPYFSGSPLFFSFGFLSLRLL